jgi:hypothetical protein
MIEHEVADPLAVFAERVVGRYVIYLDTNVWIDLVEGKSQVTREALEYARIAQRAKIATFPLAYASITELLKQPLGDTSRRQGHLMDELSDGVSLRGPGQIRALEVRNVHEYVLTGATRPYREQAFTVTACFLGDGSLEYPPNTPRAVAEELSADIIRNLPGVSWLHEHLANGDYRERHASAEREWLAEILRRDEAASQALRNDDGSFNSKSLRIEEHTYVFREHILRLLPRLVGPVAMAEALQQFRDRGVKGSAATLATIIGAMPAESLGCEMHVQRRLAVDRPPRPQDMLDYDHASMGVAYSDAFATSDGELGDLLRRCQKRVKFTSRVLRGMSMLREHLLTLLDERTVQA